MEFYFTLDNIKEIATLFWKHVGDVRVFAFHGNMGSGKTTFIHALCDVKGVMDPVGSPTFSIINEYVFNDETGEKKIFHIDLYRLKDKEEAVQAGVEDCLFSDHISFVEWAERAPGIFPEETIHVHIDIADPPNRKLRIERN